MGNQPTEITTKPHGNAFDEKKPERLPYFCNSVSLNSNIQYKKYKTTKFSVENEIPIEEISMLLTFDSKITFPEMYNRKGERIKGHAITILNFVLG